MPDSRRPAPRNRSGSGSAFGNRSGSGSAFAFGNRSGSAFAFGLLAYAFAAIMVGTTLPTPMYALYAERMHFAVLTTTVIYATYAGGVQFAQLVFHVAHRLRRLDLSIEL